MPVGVMVKDRYCESCDGTTKHTLEIYHVEKRIKTKCHLCGSTDDSPYTGNQNQKQNVQEGVSNSDTLGTKTQTAPSDNPQDDSGWANVASKEDNGDSTFPADLNSCKTRRTK